VDILFIEIIENIFIAQHKNKEQKLIYLNKSSDKLDLLKFLLQISWEIKALDNKKYILLSQKLNEIGRMLGGWQKQTQTPYKMGLWMKRVSNEDPTIVRAEDVLRIEPIRIEPQVIIVVFNVEHVQIVVGIS